MVKAIIAYFKGVIEEFKKISFPPTRSVINETILVVVSIAVAVVFLAGVDFLFTQLIRLVVTQGS